MKKILGALLILLILTSCSKQEPTPQDRFAEYISLWNQQKFDKMYDYLSSTAKQAVTKKEFISRYQKIYKDLQISGLKVVYKKPKDAQQPKDDKVTLHFSAKMNSMAGDIQFAHNAVLTNEEQDKQKNWYVNWDTTFIFPQLHQGDKISISTTEPKRGEILDRNGNGMAVNGQVYEVGLIAGQIPDQVTQQLATLLKMTPDEIHNALSAGWVKPGLFVPLKKVAMDDPRVPKLVALDPVRTKKVPARIYPYGEAAAQLIGYVGPVTADDLEKNKNLSEQDVIGKRGLEQVYDAELRGQAGVQVLINKRNGGQEVLAEKPVQDGKQVQLTIDANMQTKLFGELTGEAGTAGAMNPKTGETLALVSSPSFNPNQAELGFSADELKALQDNKQQPFTTRFKIGYAPGSTLKPLTTSIGLANGSIVPSQNIAITGKKWQRDKSWGGYFVTRVDQVSPVNLEKALIYSDNIYFAQAALRMGKNAFEAGLKGFGFEEDLGYPFPLSTSQIGTLGSDISLADSAYGQGEVQMNIVHLMASYTPFVNNGNMIKPTLLLDEPKSQVWKANVVSPANAALISGILQKVVSDPAGTAHAADIPGFPLAGKTGTAEIKEKQGTVGTENGLFVTYNTNQPSLMVGMIVENVQTRGGSVVPVKKVKDFIMKVHK